MAWQGRCRLADCGWIGVVLFNKTEAEADAAEHDICMARIGPERHATEVVGVASGQRCVWSACRREHAPDKSRAHYLGFCSIACQHAAVRAWLGGRWHADRYWQVLPGPGRSGARLDLRPFLDRLKIERREAGWPERRRPELDVLKGDARC